MTRRPLAVLSAAAALAASGCGAGSCGYLDPPTGTRSTVVRVPEDSTAMVSWRIGEHCRTA
jgi:hypothetical protein